MSAGCRKYTSITNVGGNGALQANVIQKHNASFVVDFTLDGKFEVDKRYIGVCSFKVTIKNTKG